MNNTDKREYVKNELVRMGNGCAKNLMGFVVWKRSGNMFSVNNANDSRDLWSVVDMLAPK